MEGEGFGWRESEPGSAGPTSGESDLDDSDSAMRDN